jgi:hypothetical protein
MHLYTQPFTLLFTSTKVLRPSGQPEISEDRALPGVLSQVSTLHCLRLGGTK